MLEHSPVLQALSIKFDALQRLARHREALECAKERYTVWAMNHMRNPGSIRAALSFIQSCQHNGEYEDAVLYARHAMLMVNEMTDNFILGDQRQKYLADVSYVLARAIYSLATAGGIPPEEKQKAGEEAIKLAQQALEIRTQLHGTESVKVANCMGILADILDHFNDVDDDKVLRLIEQSIAITRRVEGSLSANVAVGENNLGVAYKNRANRAQAVNDVDRYVANLELALSHYREAARIHRANNHMDYADETLRSIAEVEENRRQIGIAQAAAAVAAAAIRG